MCEDSSPVAALTFLQNDVSAVVNHDDPEEANAFLPLLSHLLSRSPVAPVLPLASATSSDPTRSVDSPTSTDSGSGEWTSSLQTDEDAEMGDSYANLTSSEAMFGSTNATGDDPYELQLRGGKRLSDARFNQRTEVFEGLLRFVDNAEVQPWESLLDVLDKS